jgi:hypothetical protein
MNAGKAAIAVVAIAFLFQNASPATSEAQQYKDALYDKYLESLEKARDNYLQLIRTAKEMNIEKSRWLDSACARVNEINKFLGDNKDSTCCKKPEPAKGAAKKGK